MQKMLLSLKVTGSLKDYLSCEIIFDKKKTKALIHQPHLLKKLKEKFGRKVANMREYRVTRSMTRSENFGNSNCKETEEELAELNQLATNVFETPTQSMALIVMAKETIRNEKDDEKSYKRWIERYFQRKYAILEIGGE